MRLFAVGALALLAAACSASDDEGTTSEDALTGGTWVLPAAVAEVGSNVSIPYESPGSWNGGHGCSGKLREGARSLGREIMTRFGQVTSIGGYSCRRNTANASALSVHGTGKALDIMLPTKNGGANSALGDPIANWLVVHAAEIGVQYIIWNHTQWKANGANTSRYGGPVPHVDHIHAEITEKAAKLQTPFFNQMQHSGPVAANDPTGANGPTGANDPTGANGPGANDIPVFGNDQPNEDPTVTQGNAPGASTPTQPALPAAPPSGGETTPTPSVAPLPASNPEPDDPGETDSLGVTRAPKTSDADQSPIVGGCAAAPTRGSRDVPAPVAAVGLATLVVVTRRRRRAG